MLCCGSDNPLYVLHASEIFYIAEVYVFLPMIRLFLNFFSALCCFTTLPVCGQTRALPQAHAHNDYEHERPLLDALSYGFTSIEADIHLINGELYVAHNRPAAPDEKTTLRTLYLDPLRAQIRRQGFVYKGYTEPLMLMIDVKSEAKATYRKLLEQLQSYTDILQTRSHPQGLVRIVLSGNRAIHLAQQDTNSTVGIDGRPDDLSQNDDPMLMPVISQHYGKVLQWKGKGDIPPQELTALKALADQTHRQGKKLRLWASPETEKVWQVLLQAGVDYINTDQLASLQQFLLRRKE